MKTYAYVATETCRYTRAVELGGYDGDTRVSQSGDYHPWTSGKRETLRLMAAGGCAEAYTRRAASAVARLKGWMQ